MVYDPCTIMNSPDPAKYQVGDEIEFVKADGLHWIITILGTTEDGEYPAMWWDGRPHLLYIMEEGLDALRIIGRRQHTAETIAMHRQMLGLDPWPAEMAA